MKALKLLIKTLVVQANHDLIVNTILVWEASL